LLLLGVGIGFGYSALLAGLSVRRAGPCVSGLARAGGIQQKTRVYIEDAGTKMPLAVVAMAAEVTDVG
jgi:hypothetical protein